MWCPDATLAQLTPAGIHFLKKERKSKGV